jgi:hypothetical protein
MHTVRPFPIVALIVGAACVSCRKATPSATRSAASAGAQEGVPPESTGPALVECTAPAFSSPIAALRVGHATVVAGLVAAARAIRLTALRDGRTLWTSDALSGVSWVPDSDLRLERAGEGMALAWRGGKQDNGRGKLVLVGPEGEPRGAPEDAGAEWCATSDRVAWVAPRAQGPVRVYARSWADPSPREIAVVAPERTVTLVCGDHDVFVLGDGDDDLTSVTFDPRTDAALPPTVVIRDSDFGSDELEHRVYTSGDDLEIVRIASTGAIAVREVRGSGVPGAWRKLKHSLGPDDDVVTVDGDEKTTLVVFTRPSETACPGIGSAAERVEALWLDRTPAVETLVDLAPADCSRAPGPFWSALAVGRSPIVAWVERRTDPSPGAPSLAGLAYRVMRSDGVQSRRVEVEADALVDAGCDEIGCFAAALVRGSDRDAMAPLSIDVVKYAW